MKLNLKLNLKLMVLFGIATLFACNNSPSTTSTENLLPLTEQETTDLLQLGEEEKLARDVYLYAYDKYNLSISKNIANSEQTHMDKAIEIVKKYGLEDPTNPERGIFNDEALQALYVQLTAKVDSSLVDALLVGATIEDLDIKDIEDFIGRTDKADILSMYESLMCGSRNHMRSYNSQLVQNSATYTPVFISQMEFDEIVSSDSEKCGQ